MTTLPQSRRPDGSLRPAVRVKAGYVPPEEQKKFGREEFKPAAADAGVVGEPDARTPGDERPHAFVVLKPETQLSAVDVTNFVAGRVAAYKHVRNVTFVEEIPKSASGKILRRVLRDRLKEGSSP